MDLMFPVDTKQGWCMCDSISDTPFPYPDSRVTRMEDENCRLFTMGAGPSQGWGLLNGSPAVLPSHGPIPPRGPTLQGL